MDARSDKTRVLVIDDSVVARRMVARVIDDTEDLRVEATAANGRIGIAKLNIRAFDAVVLDVEMPGLDGMQTCRRLKSMEKTAHVPIIFLTAIGTLEKELEGLEQGAIDYLSKPCAPERLLAKVEQQLHAAQERRELARRAHEDQLTGLANRYTLQSVLDREWQAALRNETPLSVILIDVDHFKTMNDRYGHAVGDVCLQRVAKAIASHAQRAHDLSARYGGEEFIVMLPDTDWGGACETAEAIRQSVQALDLGLNGQGSDVTISAGVACHRPRWWKGKPDLTPEMLIKLADQRLYRAKACGRNRVYAGGVLPAGQMSQSSGAGSDRSRDVTGRGRGAGK